MTVKEPRQPIEISCFGCLAAVLGMIVVIVAAVALIIYMYIPELNPNIYRHRIKEELEQRLNADVQIGFILPIFFPGIGVKVSDVVIKYKAPGAAAAEDFMKVKSIKAVLEKDPLLKEKKTIWREIIIDQPTITLRRDAEGHFVTRNIIKPREERKKSEEPKNKHEEPKGFTSRLRSWAMQKIPIPERNIENLLNLKKVAVRDARVIIIDQAQPKPALRTPIDLSRVNITVDGISATTPGTFTLDLPFPQTDRESGPRLNLSGKLSLDLISKSIAFKDVHGSWGENQFHQIELRLTRNDKRIQGIMDVEATVNLADARPVLMWPPIHRSDIVDIIAGRGQVKLKAHLEFPEPDRTSKMKYKGYAQVLDAFFDPGRVIAPLDHVTVTIELEDGKVIMPENNLTIGDMPVTGSVVMTEAKNPYFLVNATAESIDFAKLFPRRATSWGQRKPGEQLKPTRTDWEGKIRLGKAFYNKIHIENGVAHWTAKNRILKFLSARLDACRGSFEDEGSWVAFDDPPNVTMYVNGHIKGMDVTAFVDQILNTTTFVKGNFDADGYIQGIFVNGDFKTDRLDGELKLRIKDGQLVGYNMAVKILNFIGLGIDEKKYAQPFEKTRVDVKLRNGIAYFDNMELRNWNLEVRVAGQVDFVRQTIDLKMAIYPLQALSTLTRPLPLIGELVNKSQETLSGQYWKATGSWDNPQVESYIPWAEQKPKLPGVPQAPDKKSIKDQLNKIFKPGSADGEQKNEKQDQNAP